MTIDAMQTAMTEQERMELVDRHASAEMVQDWDGTWDTLDPEGSYDYFPLGIRISGREAMQEHWRRLFGNPALKDIADTVLTRWSREEDVVLVTQAPVNMPDGSVRYSVSTALFSFRGDKIFRESVFAEVPPKFTSFGSCRRTLIVHGLPGRRRAVSSASRHQAGRQVSAVRKCRPARQTRTR